MTTLSWTWRYYVYLLKIFVSKLSKFQVSRIMPAKMYQLQSPPPTTHAEITPIKIM